MILSLVVGDGCLSVVKWGNGTMGKLTIDHGIKQSDYQKWKAELLSNILDKRIKVSTGHKGKSIQIQLYHRRFKAWRKFCYPNGKKDVTKIIKYINNPWFFVAVWLMDDGYCESSISKLADGSKRNYGARFRIFSCETPLEKQDDLINWFQENTETVPKVKIQKNKKTKKSYPFLKFTQEDSLKIWKEIREFVLQFKSMRYKFRYIEQIYQKKLSK